MSKFKIYYSNEYGKNRTEVVQKILEEESQSFDLIEDYKKVYTTTKGTSQMAIFYLDKYIGYSYTNLVDFLNEQGLILC